MKFYEVTTRYFDSGKVEAFLQVVRAGKKPESTYTEHSKCDEYREYFKTLQEAENWRQDALNA